MSKKNSKSLASHFAKSHFATSLLLCVTGCCLMLGLAACDRGAGAQEEAARAFADAVTRNDQPQRDGMIATRTFKEYFENAFVSRDMLDWFRTFYDYKNRKFFGAARTDVDRDLSGELSGALIDTNKIEETGLVRVASPTAGDQPAVFRMVKQANMHWKVAMVTRGDAQVQFH
jgi:hypothetical protein